MKNYIGIDNGVTGTIAIINEDGIVAKNTPTIKQQNYTKKKGNVTRIDVVELTGIFSNNIVGNYQNSIVLIERPMVNPTRFQATMSAIRALEATLGVLETLGLPYMYIDSKEWQKEFLPKGIKGAPELKKASLDIGVRLFPEYKEYIEEHGDADGLLIAEYAKRKY